MKRFQWLVANAHQVSLDCNQHRCYYEPIKEKLEEDFCSDMSAEERAECLAKDTLCFLQMYPSTPVGFVVFAHWDPEVCVERAYRWLRKERGLPEDSDATPIQDAGPHPKDEE